MHQLKKIVEKLYLSRYLKATIDVTGSIGNIELLENGVKYGEQILNHWRDTHLLDREVTANFMGSNGYDYFNDSLDRFNFIFSKQFYETIRNVQKPLHNAQYPIQLKTVQTLQSSVSSEGHNRIFLVTDLITRNAQGLSKFFNSQRECKIWWMRFSSDPSKYYLDSYKFDNRQISTLPTGTQSITIKSKLPHATLDVERITFLPLTSIRLDKDLTNNKEDMIAVIRSVIDLHAATNALLFDSAENNTENTILINRKLAPFQCAVACYHQGKHLSDLEDLCLHLHFVLKRVGLRLHTENQLITESQEELDCGLHKCDCLGIPYTLIINESTLKTGLIKLRSRDTTLEETIHISDIPVYLIQIFTS